MQVIWKIMKDFKKARINHESERSVKHCRPHPAWRGSGMGRYQGDTWRWHCIWMRIRVHSAGLCERSCGICKGQAGNLYRYRFSERLSHNGCQGIRSKGCGCKRRAGNWYGDSYRSPEKQTVSADWRRNPCGSWSMWWQDFKGHYRNLPAYWRRKNKNVRNCDKSRSGIH